MAFLGGSGTVGDQERRDQDLVQTTVVSGRRRLDTLYFGRLWWWAERGQESANACVGASSATSRLHRGNTAPTERLAGTLEESRRVCLKAGHHEMRRARRGDSRGGNSDRFIGLVQWRPFNSRMDRPKVPWRRVRWERWSTRRR